MAAFTTADAAERLAKKQVSRQLGVGAGVRPGTQVPVGRQGVVGAVRRGLGTVYDWAKNQPGQQVSTPINTGAGVSMGGQQNVVQNVVEPVRAATRRAIGDFTAIPGVGRPSASPTAADIRAGNWAGPVVDYVTLLSTAAGASPKIRKPVSPTKSLLSDFATDQTTGVLRSLSRDIDEFVSDIGRINPNLMRQYALNKNLFNNLTPENLATVRRLDPDLDNFIQNYIGASKEFMEKQGILGWPERSSQTPGSQPRLMTPGQRARQIRNEYSVPLEEALVMAKIEDDFRAAALEMGLQMNLSPRDYQYWVNTVRNGNIDDIRALNDDLDRMWGTINEMEGFGPE